MVACSNGLKLAETIRGPKGRLFWGLMISLVCSLGAAVYISLHMAYTYGAVNLDALGTVGGHGWPYIGPTIMEMPEMNVRGWIFRGIGGLAEGFSGLGSAPLVLVAPAPPRLRHRRGLAHRPYLVLGDDSLGHQN